VLAVGLGNAIGRESGTVLFSLTAATSVWILAFAAALGVISGAAPAIRAARLDPVQALRHE